MAHGEGGTMLEEPPHESRRERRERSRAGRRSSRSRSRSVPESEPDEGALSPRQERRLRDRRRRFWLVLMPTVAVLLAASVGIGAAIRSDSDPPAAGGTSDPPARVRTMDTVLVAHRGADGRIDLLFLAGATPKSASVMLFPVASQVEVPSLGPTELADLPNDGDSSLLQTTIENLLGVKVAKTVVLDDAGLNAALAPSAPLTIALGKEVEFAGTNEAPLPPGTKRAATGAAARLLVARQTGSELDRLVTVQDVLDAWMDRLRTPSVAKNTLRAQPGLAALVAAASVPASERQTDTLPVESVTTGGTERFEPDAADIKRYAATAFPDALLAVGTGRPRVEILNGTGAVGLAQTIAARVVPAGGQVTLTGNVANFGLKDTQIVYYRTRDRAAAQRMLRAVGCGELKEAATAIGVVDVTILAGADCFRTGTPSAP